MLAMPAFPSCEERILHIVFHLLRGNASDSFLAKDMADLRCGKRIGVVKLRKFSLALLLGKLWTVVIERIPTLLDSLPSGAL
jgi:hypothetical protein